MYFCEVYCGCVEVGGRGGVGVIVFVCECFISFFFWGGVRVFYCLEVCFVFLFGDW